MAAIPDSVHDLFEKRTFAHVATLMDDGTPQVTPVWVDYDVDSDRLLINTARGRSKQRNLERNPKIGISMIDPADPYRFVSVRGTVESMTEEGAIDHIDELAGRYMDVDEYPNRNGEEGDRIIVEIRPDHVVTS